MALNPKSFSQIVSDQAAAAQASATALLDFSVGSILLAIAQSVAGVALWLYAQIWALLRTTRAATSQGTDLDSWMADFGLTRVAGYASTGNVLLSRFTTDASQPIVNPGLLAQTADGSQQFMIYADPTNPNWNYGGGYYQFAPSQASITVPVVSVKVGSATNVSAGTVSVLYQAIPFVDTVTNVAAFAGGADAETDAAFRARFQAWVIGLSRGDLFGLAYALESATDLANLQYTVTENYSVDGIWTPGFFFVVADDGTGYPSSAYLTLVTSTVNSVRPLSVRFTVIPPQVALPVIQMQIVSKPGYINYVVCAQVQANVIAGINALGLGAGIEWGDIYAFAKNTPGVSTISNLLVDDKVSDAATYAPNPLATIKANSSTVTVS